ncbi:MAG TPA: hypothetical protein VM821_04660 [Abditibacteriaceae bacterium]|nr:hypothetical protein [Abditibacteriaceae bacterium]
MSDWTEEWIMRALESGDEARLDIARLFIASQDEPFRDPQYTLQLLDEARNLAFQLNELWWVLKCDFWKMQALRWGLSDYKTALDLAVRSSVEARKRVYAGCEYRVHIHLELVANYAGVDACGYAQRVHEALQFLESEALTTSNCHFMLHEARSDFAFEKELGCGTNNWNEAHDAALNYLAAAQQSSSRFERDHYSSNSFYRLCRVAHQQQSWDEMIEYSKSGEECARRRDNHVHLIELLMWRALSERQLQREKEAARHYRSALQIASYLGATPWPGYFDAACAFHEAKGDLEPSLQMREFQLKCLQDKGQNALEARGHWHRCHLMGELGRLTAADLQAASEVAQRLVEPQRALHKLEQLRIEYSMGE